MTDTAKRLTGPAQLSNSAATKYTAPNPGRTILRHLHVQNPSSSAVNFTFSIGADAAATRLWDAFPIDPYGTFDWSGFMVLDAGEIIQSFASTTAILTLTVSGVEVT